MSRSISGVAAMDPLADLYPIVIPPVMWRPYECFGEGLRFRGPQSLRYARDSLVNIKAMLAAVDEDDEEEDAPEFRHNRKLFRPARVKKMSKSIDPRSGIYWNAQLRLYGVDCQPARAGVLRKQFRDAIANGLRGPPERLIQMEMRLNRQFLVENAQERDKQYEALTDMVKKIKFYPKRFLHEFFADEKQSVLVLHQSLPFEVQDAALALDLHFASTSAHGDIWTIVGRDALSVQERKETIESEREAKRNGKRQKVEDTREKKKVEETREKRQKGKTHESNDEREKPKIDAKKAGKRKGKMQETPTQEGKDKMKDTMSQEEFRKLDITRMDRLWRTLDDDRKLDLYPTRFLSEHFFSEGRENFVQIFKDNQTKNRLSEICAAAKLLGLCFAVFQNVTGEHDDKVTIIGRKMLAVENMRKKMEVKQDTLGEADNLAETLDGANKHAGSSGEASQQEHNLVEANEHVDMKGEAHKQDDTVGQVDEKDDTMGEATKDDDTMGEAAKHEGTTGEAANRAGTVGEAANQDVIMGEATKEDGNAGEAAKEQDGIVGEAAIQDDIVGDSTKQVDTMGEAAKEDGVMGQDDTIGEANKQADIMGEVDNQDNQDEAVCEVDEQDDTIGEVDKQDDTIDEVDKEDDTKSDVDKQDGTLDEAGKEIDTLTESVKQEDTQQEENTVGEINKHYDELSEAMKLQESPDMFLAELFGEEGEDRLLTITIEPPPELKNALKLDHVLKQEGNDKLVALQTRPGQKLFDAVAALGLHMEVEAAGGQWILMGRDPSFVRERAQLLWDETQKLKYEYEKNKMELQVQALRKELGVESGTSVVFDDLKGEWRIDCDGVEWNDDLDESFEDDYTYEDISENPNAAGYNGALKKMSIFFHPVPEKDKSGEHSTTSLRLCANFYMGLFGGLLRSTSAAPQSFSFPSEEISFTFKGWDEIAGVPFDLEREPREGNLTFLSRIEFKGILKCMYGDMKIIGRKMSNHSNVQCYDWDDLPPHE